MKNPHYQSAVLRERLGLSRSEWGRALGVHERTVTRWEQGTDPGGVALAVMRGITAALDEGVELELVKSLVGMGVSSLLYTCLKDRR